MNEAVEKNVSILKVKAQPIEILFKHFLEGEKENLGTFEKNALVS
jgi:hypothetical protein